eukprot:2982050-Prymnesium_polylepis.1
MAGGDRARRGEARPRHGFSSSRRRPHARAFTVWVGSGQSKQGEALDLFLPRLDEPRTRASLTAGTKKKKKNSTKE